MDWFRFFGSKVRREARSIGARLPDLAGVARLLRRRDLSQSFADPDMAAKQRKIVDAQLAAMRAGDAPGHFRVVAEMLEQARPKSGLQKLTVLDAGCGSAYYAEILDFFWPGGTSYVGADYNPGMLAEARSYYPELSLVRMDLRYLAVREESFDVVLSGAAIVNIEKWETVVRELARATRRWLLLHRTLVYTDGRSTSVKVERAYDRSVYVVCINEAELMDLMGDLKLNLVARRDSGEGRFPTGEGNNTYLFEKRNVGPR